MLDFFSFSFITFIGYCGVVGENIYKPNHPDSEEEKTDDKVQNDIMYYQIKRT